MPKTGSPHSSTMLKQYIKILRNCAETGGMPLQYESNAALNGVINSLEDEGLLRIKRGSEFFNDSFCIVTPKGAMALIEWEAFIKEKTFRYKFFIGASRLLWVLICVASASLEDIIHLINCG